MIGYLRGKQLRREAVPAYLSKGEKEHLSIYIKYLLPVVCVRKTRKVGDELTLNCYKTLHIYVYECFYILFIAKFAKERDILIKTLLFG